MRLLLLSVSGLEHCKSNVMIVGQKVRYFRSSRAGYVKYAATIEKVTKRTVFIRWKDKDGIERVSRTTLDALERYDNG